MTDRNCAAELCPYWPGEGCVRAFAPCDEDRDKEKAWLAGWYDDPSPGGGLDTW